MSSEEAAASTSADADPTVSFSVKSSDQSKYDLSLPLATTVGDLKARLAGKDYADIPADRQRLIYSGRVLKDADTLASTKIKDKHTIHLVKSAGSNVRQNPANQGSTASSTAAGAPGAAPAVPQMATGPGNNPLAQLTGARYAGFHGLPGADMFGADGGMGAPPDADSMIRMLEDPNMLQQLNEAMQNPAVLEMMENSPAMRDNPMARNMLRDPNLRRIMFDPAVIRQQLELSRAMGGGLPGMGGAGNSAFPMPGVTDTTPQTEGANNTTTTTQPPQTQPPFNPFAMLGGQGDNAANPFAALFGQPPAGTTPATSQPPTSASQPAPAANPQQPPNPFANLFGAANAPPGQGQGTDPMAQMTQQLLSNPDAMRAAMQMMQAMGGTPTNPSQSPPAGAAAQQNPFAALFGGANPFTAGFNPYGGGAPPPQDTRPPEEIYAEQLRQLNDMGFVEFERNVQALRRSGGSVQGAVEFLLSG